MHEELETAKRLNDNYWPQAAVTCIITWAEEVEGRLESINKEFETLRRVFPLISPGYTPKMEFCPCCGKKLEKEEKAKPGLHLSNPGLPEQSPEHPSTSSCCT